MVSNSIDSHSLHMVIILFLKIFFKSIPTSKPQKNS